MINFYYIISNVINEGTNSPVCLHVLQAQPTLRPCGCYFSFVVDKQTDNVNVECEQQFLE